MDIRQEAYERQLNNPDPIQYLRDIMVADNPKIDEIMGSLYGNIDVKAFEAFMSHFADGLDYVREHYGTQPAGVFLIDGANSPVEIGAFTDFSTGGIFITRELVERVITLGRGREGKAVPFVLNANEIAFVTGVEEAYHVHQAMHKPVLSLLSAAFTDMNPIDRKSSDYNTIPIEADATLVVHQAMKDKGITKYAPLIISDTTAEQTQWAADILKARTVTDAQVQR